MQDTFVGIALHGHRARVFMQEAGSALQAVTRIEAWIAAHRSDLPMAVILGGSSNGLSFVRSLARRGVPTLMLDSERFLGTFTRFGKVILLPRASESPEVWLAFLELVGSRLHTPGVLLPTSDIHTLLVARNKARLGRHFRFLVADLETVQCIVNKRTQYQHARLAGIHTPVMRFPDSVEEASALANGADYPCILKPYDSHAVRTRMAGRKVVVVRTRTELLNEYRRLTEIGVPLMIQEIIPGDDSMLYGYLAFWDERGREVSWITKRKLRQFPPDFGDGSFQVTTAAPEVAELSRRLLRSLSYCGFVSVEFKLDARDGRYRLMEINPRSVSGNQLAVSAGVDLAWIGYQHLCGNRLEAAKQKSRWRDVTLINEELDFQSFIALRRLGRITIAGWLRSLLSVRATAIWAWDDPMPLAAGITRFVRKYLLRRAAASR